MLDADGRHITGTLPDDAAGLGDTIANFTHSTGLDKLAELYTQATGKDCGCQGRQETLNKIFPYKIKP